ncbi:MAG TPA: hypothetical protein VFB04_05450 [Terriglobales bacterium]|nr:hypothetical protein [Terriglobales bacterium]
MAECSTLDGARLDAVSIIVVVEALCHYGSINENHLVTAAKPLLEHYVVMTAFPFYPIFTRQVPL